MVRAFITSKAMEQNGTPADLVNYMEKIYGDPDKVERALAQLHALRQKDGEAFVEFVPKFETLLSEGGGSNFPHAVQIAYVKAALNDEMTRALIGIIMPKEYSLFASRLQDVESQLAHYKLARTYVKPKPSANNNDNNGKNPMEAMDWEPAKASRSKQPKRVDNCGCKGAYTCGRRRAKWVTT